MGLDLEGNVAFLVPEIRKILSESPTELSLLLFQLETI